jgi:DNA replication protein DnaC
MTAATPCPRCDGTGYYKLAVPMGHPQWGKALRCPCQKAADDARAWARVQAASHYTVEMDAMTFATWETHNGQMTRFPEAYQAVFAWAFALATAAQTHHAYPPRPWIALLGPNGTGKTHLLSAAVHALRDGHRCPLYAVTPRLLDYLREGIDTHQVEKRLALVERADVLLLDEIGAEDSTDWALARLNRVLDYRYSNRLPTAMASNAKLEEWPFRLASRISDAAVVDLQRLIGTDYREQRTPPRAARVATTPRPERTAHHGR